MPPAPASDLAGAAVRIREAWDDLPPVFRDSPQFLAESLSAALGARLVVKVETANPLRSFKGRGTEILVRRLSPPAGGVVCASAGNFGQGMAYACRARGLALEVFAAETASPFKLARMRELGARVSLAGRDFDAAKAAAAAAAASGRLYVEDGREPEIATGAGTLALELTRWPEPFDAVLVPVGNGSLINGVGAWLRSASRATRVVGLVAAAAPAMALSWRARQPVATDSAATIADGVAVRIPIPEAVAETLATVDEFLEVGEEAIRRAMRLLFDHLGLVVEPAGALGVAALLEHGDRFAGQLVATPLCGGNLTREQIRDWLR